MELSSEIVDGLYSAGNHRAARALARDLLRKPEASEELRARAQRILQETEPDVFLTYVGAVGLGLMAWLVYNYVL